MAALLNYEDSLEKLDFQFIQSIIDRSLLPRKISIRSPKADLDVLVNKGNIFAFREFDVESRIWVQYPASETGDRAYEALELLTGDVLIGESISLSILNSRERAELTKRDADESIGAARPLDVISLSGWKHDKEQDVLNVATPSTVVNSVLSDFFTSIKSKVKFVYLEDNISGKAQSFGALGGIDKKVAEDLMPSILKWREAVSGALGNGPQLVTMRSPSNDGTSLVCAVDGSQYLIAEFENKTFGVVAGLWIKATRTK